MKTWKWSLLVVLVTAVGVSTVMLRTPPPHALVTEASVPNHVAEPTEAVADQSTPSATVATRERATAARLTAVRSDQPSNEIVSEPASVMRVPADLPLAKVNDQVILLKDLVPLRADEQEMEMTSEEYESRLNRAIEMEETFQAAAAQGVGLTPEQEARVERIAQKHEATVQHYHEQGFTWNSVKPEQLDFEKRLTSALLLQQNLAMEADGVSASGSGNPIR
jgi:hypothetical protein